MKRSIFSIIKEKIFLMIMALLIPVGFSACTKAAADNVVPDNAPIYHDSDLTGSVWTVGSVGFSQNMQSINVDQTQNQLNPLVLNFILNTRAVFTVDQHGLHDLELTNYHFGWSLSNDKNNTLTLTDGNIASYVLTVTSLTQSQLVLYIKFATPITVKDVNGTATSVDSMTITCKR
jgi:hypothetical protein